jgi:hypothetical protein
MSKRRFVYGVLFVLVTAAGCGEPPPPEAPPPVAPPPDPAPAKTVEPAPAPAPTAAAVAPPEPAPAPKAAKERMIGKWQFELTGEARTFHEAAARKKAGKDEAKFAKAMKEVEEAAAKEWIEMTADTYTSWVGDKIERQMSFTVVKEEGNVVTVKAVKDLVAKKDVKGDVTIPVTLKDDNTLEMFDPGKKINLTFKRKK